MARPLRLCFPGACYHVMTRGNAKSPIFLDEEDYRRFLDILKDAAGRSSLLVYAYCLMPNHYHLVCKTEQANLSRAMGYLNSVYAHGWNIRHGRCGHVTQGRFKAQLVQSGIYLCVVCRYVLNNPVRAGLVHHPQDWPWSSFRYAVSPETAPAFLDVSLTRDMIDACDPKAPTSGATTSRLQDAVGEAVRSDSRVIGERLFLRGQRKLVAASKRAGVPRSEWSGVRPTLAELFAFTGDLAQRRSRVLEACETWGFTQLEVARFLNENEDSIGRICRRARAKASPANMSHSVAPEADQLSEFEI